MLSFGFLLDSCCLLLSFYPLLMIRKVTFPLLLVLFSATLVLSAGFTLFRARYNDAGERMQEQGSNESDVPAYDLCRKASVEPAFARWAAVSSSGFGPYPYFDPNVYCGTAAAQIGGPFNYRFSVRTATGDQTYTNALSQTAGPMQRSWGSIKSMFR